MNLSSRPISIIALLLSLMVLGYVLNDIWQRHFQAQTEVVQAPKAANKSKSLAQTNIATIIRAHLFGQLQQKQKPRVVKAPPTRLNLKLVGIVLASEQGESRVLIETANNKQQVVIIDQKIGKSGATLSAVEKDFVLIKHAGKLEKLAMQRPVLQARAKKRKQP